MKKAIILGAGPIGLVTAWKLLEEDWDVEIYEKLDQVGGMCRTWKWNDFLVDTGPHIFHTPDKNLQEFWEEHFGDLFIKNDFWCKNVRGESFEEYWDYPLSWESISRYPKTLKEKIMNELDNLDSDKKARAKNYKEYMEFQVGPTLREMFFETYPEKIWGIKTKQMTPDWAPKRIEFRNKISPFYHNQWNAVGKYGTGCIYDRIRDKITELGGNFHFNYEVNSINTSGRELKSITFSNREVINLNSDNLVISSLPITLTARLLGHNSKLTFRGIRSVYLAYSVKEILPKDIHWLYYGAKNIDFNRITEPKKLSPYISPDNKTYLTAEITYSKGDAIDKMDSKALSKRIAKQVEEVGLVESKNLIDSSDNKEAFVYPLMFKGYQQELANTRAVISNFQQLYSIGTGGDYNYADSQILFHKAFDTVAIICEKSSSYTQTIRKVSPIELNPIVSIKDKKIGDTEKAYIIAEAGLNHNGSLSLAKELIHAAKKTNCDAVKFQTFKQNSRISSQVKAVKYSETVIGLEETLDDMFNRLAMPFDEQKELFEYAKEIGIDIFSTPFDNECVDFLESMDVCAYKIASFDLVNLPLIKYVASTGKPMIISTGMSNLGQIEEAVNTVRDQGNPNLILLHCNSSYPAAPDEMNLNVINNLKSLFKIPIGLSDHTFGLFVSHTAIAIGANVIERHFTLDRTFEGPDHILSSEPDEFADLVKIAKTIPLVVGNGIKTIQPNEYDTLNMQRKSLHAACYINKDQIITKEMISIKGPGGGLLPKYLDIVIGRTAREDIKYDHPIDWSMI